MDKPEMIMLVGIPASGKSTVSRDLEKKGYTLLSSDRIRDELSPVAELSKLSPEEYHALNVKVFETLKRRALAWLKVGKSIAIDSTSLNRKKRIGFLRSLGAVKIHKKCILVLTPPEICIQRNALRQGNAYVPESVIHTMLCTFNPPCKAEGWDEIKLIAADTPYSFPFDKADSFAQDNPHHTLTLGEHMKATVRYCAEQGFSERIKRVAAYHDIGKMYTKQFFNYKGEPTEDAHYYGHENYGSYLYLSEICCGISLDEVATENALYEALLINCHMRPLGYGEGAYEKDTALFGEEFMKDLMQLHEADRAAH